jgi:hypothetical protein
MGRFEQPDFTQGDPNTIGGYRAAHGRPPAFEAGDGSAYSVEIVADEIGDDRGRYAAYLLFVRWRSHDPVATGHLETGYLAFAPSEAEALTQLGAMPLQDARGHLERALGEIGGRGADSHNGDRD